MSCWVLPSPLEIPFFVTQLWKYYHSLWKLKTSDFLVQATKFWSFACFFQKIWWILWLTHRHQKVPMWKLKIYRKFRCHVLHLLWKPAWTLKIFIEQLFQFKVLLKMMLQAHSYLRKHFQQNFDKGKTIGLECKQTCVNGFMLLTIIQDFL